MNCDVTAAATGSRQEQLPQPVRGDADGHALGDAEAVNLVLVRVVVDPQQVVQGPEGEAEAGEVMHDVQRVIAVTDGLGEADAVHVGRFVAVVAVLLSTVSGGGQAVAQSPSRIDVSKLGPQTGERVPDFSLKDQDGKTTTLESIMGTKGAMLVFFRSADW